MRPTLCFNMEDFDFVSNMERRSYRTVMKPRLPRKVTASARINLNRFWNELEEFYDRRTKNNSSNSSNNFVAMPDYTTDTCDHAREEAENRANERLEEEEERMKAMKANRVNSSLNHSSSNSLNKSARMRLHSYDVVDAFEASSEDEEDDYEYDDSIPSSPVMFNNLSDVKLPSPPPPHSLLQLVSMMADKF